jgi:hypothetical protein
MCSAPKQQKIPVTPPPPAPSQPAASINQAAPLSPERSNSVEIAKKMGTAALRINLKRPRRAGPSGPSINLPRK